MVDLYKKTGIKGYQFILAVSIISSALVIIATGWRISLLVLIFLSFNAFTVIIQMIALSIMNKQVLERKFNTDMERVWDRFNLLFGGLYTVAVFVATMDTFRWGISSLPMWAIIIGIILMITSMFISTQTGLSSPPHAQYRFREEAAKNGHGAYDVVRFPFALAMLCVAIGAPLALGSGIGAGVGVLAAICVFINVSKEDHWRLKNYLWYYDYTKIVPYKLIPFIW